MQRTLAETEAASAWQVFTPTAPLTVKPYVLLNRNHHKNKTVMHSAAAVIHV